MDIKRYEACMLLGAAGDSLGYRNGRWEFNENGRNIHFQVTKLGGLSAITLSKENGFMLSDDSILHIHTAQALVSEWKTKEDLYSNIAREYKKGCHDMHGRSPGATTLNGIDMLIPDAHNGYRIPFNSSGGGCGAAMRACPIGLLYPDPNDLNDLVEVAIEAGRMTHNHPTGFLGSVAAALFVSYALQNKPIREWGAGLLKTLDIAMDYIKATNVDVRQNTVNWYYFKEKWTKYLDERGILDGNSDPVFPDPYTVDIRDDFYSSVSYSGWGGASGHDAPMIAYDALLGAGDSWEELCLRGMLHGGDNDSTGIIAGSVWGAMYGFKGVPENHYHHLEYEERMSKLAMELFRKANSIERNSEERFDDKLSLEGEVKDLALDTSAVLVTLQPAVDKELIYDISADISREKDHIQPDESGDIPQGKEYSETDVISSDISET